MFKAQNDSSFAAYSTHLNPFKKVGIDEKVLVIRGFDFMDENPRPCFSKLSIKS